MAPPFFIAVQCCQCSTMQVKQQKKSSNKWTCVVCNQKQSVRRVFAQGSMAKDLRQFVQSFNMSRQLSDNSVTLAPQDDGCEKVEEAADQISGGRDSRKQKRSNWTEYLDFKDAACEEEVIAECDGDIKIVTELPKEMFKKPKLNEYYSQLGKQAEHAELYSPAFSKRLAMKNAIFPVYIHHAFLSRQNHRLIEKPVREGSSGSGEPRKGQQGVSCIEDKITGPDSTRITTANRASKWSSYITEDDGDLQFASKNHYSGEIDQNSFDAFTTTARGQKVEDDIHPDFM